MKKFLAVFLALAMVFAMSSMAMAVNPIVEVTGVDTNGNGDTENTDSDAVTVQITGGASTTKVYNVSIVWGDLDFIYNFSSESKWNPTDHTYTTDGATGWQNGTERVITVTNHSNDAITATPSYEDGVNAINGVSFRVSNAINLADASLVAYGKPADAALANTGTVTLTVSGQPATPAAAAVVTVGTVTITIEAAD